jgi:ribose-phosphate pyrophosphokinase
LDFAVLSSKLTEGLARGVALALGSDLHVWNFKTFPDGEAYVRLNVKLEGKVAVLVATGYPQPSERVLEAMLAVEAARGLGASAVVAVMAYLPYSRQDRRFLRGEPISVRAVLEGLAASGADALVTVEVHKEHSLAWFPGPALSVEPWEELAAKLREEVDGWEKVYVVAPDAGAAKRAQGLAQRLGAPFDYLEKRRDRVTGEVKMAPKAVDVGGALVVLVDDIVSTGGTMAKAAETLREQGAASIIAACVHGLFVGGALEKLAAAGVSRVYAANTVPASPGLDVVDVSKPVAEGVKAVAEQLLGYESG